MLRILLLLVICIFIPSVRGKPDDPNPPIPPDDPPKDPDPPPPERPAQPELKCFECKACDTPDYTKDLKDCNPTLSRPACFSLSTPPEGIVNRHCGSAFGKDMGCIQNYNEGLECICDTDACNSMSAEGMDAQLQAARKKRESEVIKSRSSSASRNSWLF